MRVRVNEWTALPHRLLLERSERRKGVFVTAYQHRSAHRSLEALLRLWGLEVRRVWQPREGDEEEGEGGGGEDEGGVSGGATVDVVEIVIAPSGKEK